MSAKPTPGPYKVSNARGYVEGVGLDGQSIAYFGTTAESVANARAWVDGIEAMEKLERIRAAYKDDSLCDELLVIAVGQILDEAKP